MTKPHIPVEVLPAVIWPPVTNAIEKSLRSMRVHVPRALVGGDADYSAHQTRPGSKDTVRALPCSERIGDDILEQTNHFCHPAFTAQRRRTTPAQGDRLGGFLGGTTK